MGYCYDIEGNSVDCGSSDNVGYSSGSVSDSGAGLNLTTDNNPVASAVGTSNGPTGLSSTLSTVLNFGTSILKTVTTPTAPSNLRLQVNPSTGLQQYYNPTTGQYVGSPIQPTGAFGSNGFIFIIIALVVGFLAFGGKKALHSATA